MSQYKRNFGLDLLRCVAIAVVLLNHGYLGFFVKHGLSEWSGWRAALSMSAVLAIEWLFVLSGFLICSMMIRSFEKDRPWFSSAKDFWMRRWFRTIPNYYLFLFLNALLALWGLESGAFNWKFLVFSQNLAWPETKPHFFAESWSLALDEWFYLTMPLLVGMAAWRWGKGSKWTFIAASGGLILVSMVLRWCLVHPQNLFEWDEGVRRVTLYHLDATGWGGVAAILSRWHADWWKRWVGLKAALGAGMTVLSVAYIFHAVTRDWAALGDSRWNDFVMITMPCVALVLMLPWIAGLGGRFRWLEGSMAWLGDSSYSIYLCHFPLLLIVSHGVGWLGWRFADVAGWVAMAWALLVVGMSGLIFQFFERPVFSLRERFTRKVQAGPFQ